MGSTQTLVLSAEDVQQALSLEQALQALAGAHTAYSSKKAVQPNRLHIPVDRHHGRLLVMSAYVEPIDALVVKVVGGFHDNPARGLPAGYGVVILHDAETGAIVSVMDGFHLTGFRTAATAVLATQHMANPNPGTLAIIGGGYIGRVTAICAGQTLGIKRILVSSRRHSTTEEFVKEVEKEVSIPVMIALSAEEACRDADIIVTATASKEPVIEFKWIKPGAHINAVGSSVPTHREVDTATVQNSRVVVESIDATMAEAGDILVPLNAGEIGPEVIYAELGELISGEKRARIA